MKKDLHAEYKDLKYNYSTQEAGSDELVALDALIATKTQAEAAKLAKLPLRTIEHVIRQLRKKRDAKLLDELKNKADSHIQVPPSVAPDVAFDTDVIPWLILSDANIGLVTSVSETGTDYNIHNAYVEICRGIQLMYRQLPECERIVICDLGNLTCITDYSDKYNPKSYENMIDASVQVINFAITEALKKFNKVDVILNQGDLNEANALWTATAMRLTWAKETRVTVLDNSTAMIPYRMGNTFVVTHHGENVYSDEITDVMLADYKQHMNNTTYKYVFTAGDMREIIKTHDGVIVESFNSFAPVSKDKAKFGHRPTNSLTTIMLSKTFGEICRFTLPIEAIKDSLLKEYKNTPYPFNENKKAVFQV